MAYSDFDLKKVQKDFGVRIDEEANLFADVMPGPPSPILAANVTRSPSLADAPRARAIAAMTEAWYTEFAPQMTSNAVLLMLHHIPRISATESTRRVVP